MPPADQIQEQKEWGPSYGSCTGHEAWIDDFLVVDLPVRILQLHM